MTTKGRPRTREEQSAAGSARYAPKRAALILVAAAFVGDVRAARRHSITDRTIRNWRARLDTDEELSGYFQTAYTKATEEWRDKLTHTIVASMEFVADAVQMGDPRDPQMLMAINDSLRVLTDAKATEELLDARIRSRQDGIEGSPVYSVVAPAHQLTTPSGD